MKRLLCWCICWFVSSQLSVVRGQLPSPSLLYPIAKTVSLQNRNNGLLTTDHGLPCQNSSPACLNTLSDWAVQNNRELRVLKEAIRLQRKKRWTTWLSADGLHPLAIGLRIARNVVGGGDHAALQLELSRLELRQAELESHLYQAVAQAVQAYEAAQQQCTAAEGKLATHQARLAFLTIAYRLGEGSTDAMLQFWQTETELQHEVERARLHRTQCQRQLQALVFPLVMPSL